MHPREVAGAVEDGKVRCDHHVVGDDLAVLGFDATRRAGIDLERAGLLEDVAPVAVNLLRDRQQVFPRVKLGLLVETDRAGGVERQRRLIDEGGGETDLLSGRDLVSDRTQVVRRYSVRVRFRPPKVTVDVRFLDSLLHVIDRGLVRIGVLSRLLLAELGNERVVDQSVLGGEFSRRVTGRALDDPIGLDDRDGSSRFLQFDRRGQPGDTAADNRDVDFESVLERAILGRWRRGQPQRLLAR